MNYFAHGLGSIGRPWRLAGTATPDWLGAADRSMRLRRKKVRPFATGDDSPRAQLAEGILQHLADDSRFHGSALFHTLTREIAASLRKAASYPAGPQPGVGRRFRPGFTAHILVELLLDSALIEDDPARLDRYYADLASIDPAEVADSVEAITGRRPHGVEAYVERFLSLEFLRNYGDDDALIRSLDHVLGRVGLAPLPAATLGTIVEVRAFVRRRRDELLASSVPG